MALVIYGFCLPTNASACNFQNNELRFNGVRILHFSYHWSLFQMGKYNFRLPLADDIKAPIPSDAEETVFELEDSNVEHTLNSGTTVKESVENNSEEGFIKVHPKSSTENPFEENEENVITDYGDEHHTAEQEFDLADDRRYDI